jgi:hypothetical protein
VKFYLATVHKLVNVQDALPKSLQGKAKADLKEIWMAPTFEADGYSRSFFTI